jgi:diguanylate cyclase (GGDEF)-like protein/PAS domain S-box-containing protein
MKIIRDLERNIVVVVAVIACLVWIADAAIDAYIFGHGSFLDLAFFEVTPHEFYFRFFVIAVYSVATVILVKNTGKSRRAQTELQKHLAAIESSMDGIAIFDADHIYQYANEAYARITGYGKPEALLGRSFSLIYDDQQVDWILQNIFPALEREGRWHGELTARRKDGSLLEQDASITRLEDGTCTCVMHDITGLRERERSISRSERFLRTIFDSIRDPFCIIDRNYTIVRANEAYAQLKNKAVGDLVNRTCYRAMYGTEDVCDGCVVRKTLQSADPCAKEKKVTLTNGDTAWLEIYTYPLLDESGRISHVIEYTRDVTDRKKSEEDRRRLIDRLEYLSKVDGLTGLLNRRALAEQLEYEIDRAKRYDSELSIILCDLDNLKEINDRYGHLTGDTTLQLVAASLRSSLRNVDIAGRYGGDEFMVIVPQTAIAGASSIAEKIRTSVKMTDVRIDDQTRVSISLSMGVAALKVPSETMDAFVSRVDAALYSSKNAGRDRVTIAS